MKVVRNLLISSTEPTDANAGWLKPLPDGNFKLFFFNNGGWTPLIDYMKYSTPAGSSDNIYNCT